MLICDCHQNNCPSFPKLGFGHHDEDVANNSQTHVCKDTGVKQQNHKFNHFIINVSNMWSCYRSAGGAFGKMEAAHEDQYFRQLVMLNF